MILFISMAILDLLGGALPGLPFQTIRLLATFFTHAKFLPFHITFIDFILD